MDQLNHHSSANRLLSLLPSDELERIRPHLLPVQLAPGQVVYEPSAPVHYVYFIDYGMASIVSIMENGDTIEVGTVGNKGVAGLPGVLSGGVSGPFRHFVQVPGFARRMSAEILEAELDHESKLRSLLLRYQTAMLHQVMQGVACNGLHSVEQRCCKWLLMSHDVVGSDEVAITHEFIAQMLGVRRASVSDVLRPLQQQGLIRATRGKVTILDRHGLAETSCECYHVISAEYERLLK